MGYTKVGLHRRRYQIDASEASVGCTTCTGVSGCFVVSRVIDVIVSKLSCAVLDASDGE